MTALARIASPASLPAPPLRWCRPWRGLYSWSPSAGGNAGGMFMMRGGAMMLVSLMMIPFAFMVQLMVVVYGTFLWMAWCYAVLTAWLFYVIAVYAVRTVWRYGDYLANRKVH